MKRWRPSAPAVVALGAALVAVLLGALQAGPWHAPGYVLLSTAALAALFGAVGIAHLRAGGRAVAWPSPVAEPAPGPGRRPDPRDPKGFRYSGRATGRS